MTNRYYSYIFAGGGCAALSLVYKMQRAGLLKDKTVLIIDREQKNKNDRTWAFWTKKDTVFEKIVSNTWDEIEFRSQYFSEDINLSPYKYQVIKGIDFYEFVLAEIHQNENIHFLQEEILSLKKEQNKTIVKTKSATFSANWVFDSRFHPDMIPKENIFLKQHFKGWLIETPEAEFDVDKIRLFDFRTGQNGVMRFFYIIPYAPQKALVEYTLFSEHLLEEKVYDDAVEKYIDEILQIKNFKTIEEEQGIIPMTDYEFPPSSIENVINIGTLGGCSKASTGYTFLRIQKQCDEIVEALKRTNSPVTNISKSKRFVLYDALMLKVLQDKGAFAEKVFSNLFQKNPIDRLFRFLDEESSVMEEVRLMNTTPKGLFLGRIPHLPLKNLLGIETIFSFVLIIIFGGGIIAHQVPLLLAFSLKITDALLLICNLSVLGFVLKKHPSAKLFLWFVIGAILTFFIEVAGVSTGKIFGVYEYGNTLKWQWQAVPLVIGLNWMVLTMAALDIGKKYFNKILTPIIAATMVVVFDWVMEPVAIHLNYWHWFGESIPLQNYFAWFVIALVFSIIYQVLNLRTDSLVLKVYFFIQFLFFLMLGLLVCYR